VYLKQKKKQRRLTRRFLLKANSRRKKMVVELWLNQELLERYLSEREEKERLIRELINIIERNEIIVGKVNDIKFLKVSN
jgi:hypothetical protein